MLIMLDQVRTKIIWLLFQIRSSLKNKAQLSSRLWSFEPWTSSQTTKVQTYSTWEAKHRTKGCFPSTYSDIQRK